MDLKNQSLKQIINFVDINGTGTVRCINNVMRDIEVVGYFKKYHWTFIVHRDIQYPDCYVVSESSTGMCLTDFCYDTIEKAIKNTIPIIDEKRYYFFTRVNDELVSMKYNLFSRNTNLITPAINQLCIT